LYFPLLIDDNKKLSDIINQSDIEIDRLKATKDLVNEEFFPETQFVKLNYLETDLINIKPKVKSIKFGQTVSSFYIETKDDVVFLIFEDGSIYYDYLDQILNKKFDPKKIETNLPQPIEVTDLKLHEGNFYISFVKKDDEGCNFKSTNIFKAKSSLENIAFKKLFSQNEQKWERKKNLNCQIYSAPGGTMDIFKADNNEYIVISLFDQNSQNHYLPVNYSQKTNLTYKQTQIAIVDITNGDLEVYSSGHRNPTGILVIDENTILATEHGPMGGDEINRILKNKNYGFPFASYGENYSYKYTDTLSFLKNHDEGGFEEPLYAFVPSIGINKIIKIPNTFNSKWQNNYLVSSLKNLSLYRITFDKNFTRVITMERMRIKKRIRDMVYNHKHDYIILSLEDAEGTLGIIYN